MGETAIHDPSNMHDVRTDPVALRDTFRRDILGGLGAMPKATPPKHLYDATGSRIFDRITETADYYPTRAEAAILTEAMDDIARSLGPGVTVIEPGAGSGAKAARLLDALDEPRAFVPLEISGDHVLAACRRLARRFPDVDFFPIVADFTADLHLLDHTPDDNRLVFFPGSTIGNIDRRERAALLARLAEIAGDGGRLLIGFDLIKEVGVLERAYDDRDGVTEAFIRNLLDRINRELGADFRQDRFEYAAPWVAARSRIELGLRARVAHRVLVDNAVVAFDEGEFLHAESSHKFTTDGFDDEARAAGWSLVDRWTGELGWFCVALYQRD